MKMKTVVKLKASADCPSHAKSDITIRDLNFAIDEPTERGGTNEGPTPTDTVLAALIGCTNVIAHKCASQLNIDIGHLKIDIDCDFDRRGVTLSEDIDTPFTAINLNVKADGPATQTQLQAVADSVKMYCPVSKLFRQAGTVINETWTANS